MIVNTQDYSLCNRNNLYRISFGCYDEWIVGHVYVTYC